MESTARNAIAALTQAQRNKLGFSNHYSEREAKAAIEKLTAQERADNGLPSLYRLNNRNFNNSGSHTVLMGFNPTEASKMIEQLREEGFSSDTKVLREEAIKRVQKPIVYENKIKD